MAHWCLSKSQVMAQTKQNDRCQEMFVVSAVTEVIIIIIISPSWGV